MATSKGYLEFLQEQLSDLGDIRVRSMMGEYLLYYKDKLVADICDDRLFVKPIPAAVDYMPVCRYAPPYEGAKEMLLVEEVDDRQFLEGLIRLLYDNLPAPKPRKKKTDSQRS